MNDAIPYEPPLQVGSVGLRSSGFWGVVFLVISEASLFAYLFFAYYYFAVQPHPGSWPPSGPPSFTYSAPETAVLIVSSATIWWADRSATFGRRSGVLLGLGLTFLLGVAFVGLQLAEWYDKPYSFATDSYSSLTFLIEGTHLAHEVIGVIMVAAVTVWSALGYFGPLRHAPITVTSFYWYFVTVIWLALFFTIYVTPYLS
jgi:heme/copper-type cytochrome/quinol oxidase subunit 3